MTDRLLITGANGFIGRRLVQQLPLGSFGQVTCLSRRSPHDPQLEDNTGPRRWITGDIRDPGSYREHIEQTDTVIHLAALTGQQRSEDHFSINAEGTRVLLQQCQRARVRRFLHVSTIAVKFPNLAHYPYARSKIEAEDAVRRSGLPFTIVRPTIVMAAESASWKAFRSLAAGSVAVMFGDGAVRVQPIHVDDLVACMLSILHHDEFYGTVFEIGGSESTSMERFLTRIHMKYHPRRPMIVRIPLQPTVPCLVAAETVLHHRLPITAGQLSPFQHDSTIDPARAYSRLQRTLKPVAKILDTILDEELHGEAHTRILTRECRVFSMHLIGRHPDEYVVTRYLHAHRMAVELKHVRLSIFDRILIILASRNPLLSRLVDSYTRVFSPTAHIRKKWILLLAILDIDGSSHSHFDTPRRHGMVQVAFALLLAGISFLLLLVCSSIAFAPLHAACATGAKIRRRIA